MFQNAGEMIASLRIALGLIVCALSSPPADARTWEALYVFGDSYSDTGAGYLDGNGPTAVAYLAANLHIPFTYAGDPNAAGKSLNFAVSGAQTGKSEGMKVRPATAACGISEGLLGRGMENQVADFVQQVKSGLSFNPESTIFFLEGGGNDTELPTNITISNLKSQVRALYAAGARHFMVALLPLNVPKGAKTGERLNPALARIPREMATELPEVHIAMSKWGGYFDRVMARHAKYGIVNTTDRCAGRALFGEDPRPCAAPDTYFYFHDGHPSTAVHRIVGKYLQREVEGLP